MSAFNAIRAILAPGNEMLKIFYKDVTNVKKSVLRLCEHRFKFQEIAHFYIILLIINAVHFINCRKFNRFPPSAYTLTKRSLHVISHIVTSEQLGM